MAMRRRILGLMLNGRSVVAAEVRSGAGDQPVLEAAARLEIAEPLTWDDPVAIGVALAEQMRAAGMKARHAVIGLPATWVLTRSLNAPPAQGEALRKLIANKVERAFAGGIRELAIDFIPPGPANPANLAATHVLLVAAQRRRVDAAIAMAEAAGLKVSVVTATSAALASAGASGAAAERSHTLLIGGEASELVTHHRGVLQAIRPLRKPPASNADIGATLGNQLRQARVIESGQESDAAADHAADLWLWDGIGLDEAARQQITADAGAAQLREGRLDDWVHVNGATTALGEAHAAARYAGAVALAQAGVDATLRPVDWLHPRLAEPKKHALTQRSRTAIVAATLAVALACGGVFHYQSTAGEVAELEAQVADLREQVTDAREVIGRVDQAEAWYGRRTSILACLEAITAAFGDDPALWATELSLRENLNGTVAGAAVDSRLVLNVRDAMQASPAFTNVTMMHLREDDRRSGGEISWAIAFTYIGSASATGVAESEVGP